MSNRNAQHFLANRPLSDFRINLTIGPLGQAVSVNANTGRLRSARLTCEAEQPTALKAPGASTVPYCRQPPLRKDPAQLVLISSLSLC